MYGQADIYSSPASDGAIDLDEAIDQELDGSFGAILGIGKGGGILGIALTAKARENKIARLIGKLKKFYEEGNLDKARRFAKALRGPVAHLERKGKYTPSPEVRVWMQFAEDGDTAALTDALERLNWTGDEEQELSAEPGVSGSRARPGRRHLPKGYRPPRYSHWSVPHKRSWLRRHPVAASVVSPLDPVRGGGGGVVVPGPFHLGGPVYRPVVTGPIRSYGPGYRPGGSSYYRPVRDLHGTGVLHNQMEIAAARQRGRNLANARWDSHHSSTSSTAPRAPSVSMMPRAMPAAVRPASSAAMAPRSAMAARPTMARPVRFGLGEGDPIAEGVREAFGAGPVEDYLDPDVPAFGGDDEFDDDLGDEGFGGEDEFGDDEFGGEDEDLEDDEFGGILPHRTVEARVEAARAKYERKKARAVTDEDWEKVQSLFNDYKQLATAYRRGATAPTLRSHERVLAEMPEDPYFTYSQNAAKPKGGVSWDDWTQAHSMPSGSSGGEFKLHDVGETPGVGEP